MTIEEQIQASANNGLTKPAIEALLGRPLTQQEKVLYKKYRTIYELKLRKKRSERRYEHLSNAEQKRKHDDQACSITDDLNAAYLKIDWERRKRAELNLVEFTKTYLIGLALDEPPSKKGEEVLM